MESGKSKLGLILILVLILTASVSARVYIPQDVNQNYPEIAFNDKSSSKAQWDALGQSESYEIRSLTHLGPFGDYDGDGSLRIPIRATSGTPYVKANKRTSTDYFGLDDENGNDKPKSGKILSAGLIDDDLKTDLLFVDQNGELAYIDSDSYGSFSQSAGGVIGTGDVDRDGYEEYAFIGTSTNLKYYNYESGDSDPDTQSFGTASVNSKIAASTLLHLGDGDGYVEVAYQTGSSYLKAKDTKNSETGRLDDGLGNIKGFSIGTLWLEDGDGRPEMAVAGNSNEMYLCSYDDNDGDCQQTGKDNGFGISKKKTKGTRSYIPPFVKEPKLNKTPVTQGESVKVVFNATDWEGYTDIVNKTAEVKFTSPSGASHIVDANEFTKGSAVTGSSKAGGFVPEDGKTKAFKATFNMPDDADTTQDWNVTVQVKDEKMTGTLNWTTFTVEKALVEKNISQGISMNRKDISRQTSLAKLDSTGLNYAPVSLTNSFTNRLSTESFGFSSGKDRNQSVGKNVITGMSFTRSGSNSKSAFSLLSSRIVTGSTVSDIYSTAQMFSPIFGLSSSTSDKAKSRSSIGETFGVDISQEKGLIQETVNLILGISPTSEERSAQVERKRGTNLGVNPSSQRLQYYGRSIQPILSFSPSLKRSQDALRLLGYQLVAEPDYLRDQDLNRNESNTITGAFTSSRYSSVERLVLGTITSDLIGTRGTGNFRRKTQYSYSSSNSLAGSLAKSVSYGLGFSSSPLRSGAGLARVMNEEFRPEALASVDSKFYRGRTQSLQVQNSFYGTGMFFGSVTDSYLVDTPVSDTLENVRYISQVFAGGDQRETTSSFERGKNQGIKSSDKPVRNTLTSRMFKSNFATSLTPDAFEGALIVLDEVIGLNEDQKDSFESSREETTSFKTSSSTSSGVNFFRGFTQSLDVGLGLQDLTDFINQFFSNEENTDSNNDDIPFIPPVNDDEDNVSNKNQTKEPPHNIEERPKDEDNRLNSSEEIEIVNASLKYDSRTTIFSSDEQIIKKDNIESGKTVSIEFKEIEEPSNSSETKKNSSEPDIKLENIHFESENNVSNPNIEVLSSRKPNNSSLELKNGKIYEQTKISSNFGTQNAYITYNVKKQFLRSKNANKDQISVYRWNDTGYRTELSTKIQESNRSYTVRAFSPRGFSTIGVVIKQSTDLKNRAETNMWLKIENFPIINLIKLLLVVSSIYLVRITLKRYLFTVDIRLEYIYDRMRLELERIKSKYINRRESSLGKKEYEVAQDIVHLQNQKEVLKYRKEKLRNQIQRKKELKERYQNSLEELSSRIDRWSQKLEN